MAQQALRIAATHARLPGEAKREAGGLYDTRFRRLLGQSEWASLPAAIRRRFSKRIAGEKVAIYPGVIRAARFSRWGSALAQLCRVIGAPLPLERACGLPAAVSVSEDHQGAGQFWTRVYGRSYGFPQVIHSAKRFAGPTGLEEHIGHGVGMALSLHVRPDALEFRSDHYFVTLLGRRVRLPRWLSPGETIVIHRHVDEASFEFSLALRHPLLGELIYQEGLFRDV
ncbi:MAG: DUF4166 domain-containing protein [Pseudomonadota bacterium]